MKQNLKFYLSRLSTLPKTVYFNFRWLPFRQALRLPVWTAWNVRVKNMRRGGIELPEKVVPGLIRLGYHQSDAVDSYGVHTVIDVRKGGILKFQGSAHIACGAILCVKETGIMELGNNFAISGTTSIVCHKHIKMGKDVQLGWNTLIMDSDVHTIIGEDGKEIPNTEPVTVGDKVIVYVNTTILKGVNIPSNCVVGVNSVLTKPFRNESMLIAGAPAKEIKRIGGWHL